MSETTALTASEVPHVRAGRRRRVILSTLLAEAAGLELDADRRWRKRSAHGPP